MSTKEFNTKLVEQANNLKYFALSLTKNTEDANDLLQDTYLRAMIYKDKFNPTTNIKLWVFTIMKNIFINNYRRNNRIGKVVDSTKDLFLINQSQPACNQLIDSEYTVKEINGKIEKLPDDLKTSFKLYISGYKYKEIAEQLNIPIGTVKSRIYFARLKLANVYKLEN